MINTSIDSLENYDGISFIIYLGLHPSKLLKIQYNYIVIKKFSDREIKNLHHIPIDKFRNGIHFVISSESLINNKSQIEEVQKWVLHVYYKYFLYPSSSPEIPDYQLVRKEPLFDILHHIRLAENIPLYLSHPLADKILLLGRNLPAFLLLPGPSIKKYSQHLQAIKNRFVLITLARCLELCYQKNAIPDFVLQLDCNSLQGIMFPEHIDFSNTTLITLSVAPIYGIAQRFKNCFFIDSFNLDIHPNPFRIRESWLSSLLPCLGLIETLGCSDVVLAGADLSFTEASGVYHSDSCQQTDQYQHCEQPYLDSKKRYIKMKDRQGAECLTTFPYFAMAGEAEQFMRIIHQKNGTRFYILEDKGILSSKVASGISVDHLLDRPVLIKSDFESSLQRADTPPINNIHLIKLKASLLQQLHSVSKQQTLFAQTNPENFNDLQDHPFIKSVQKFSKSNRLPMLTQQQCFFTVLEMLRHWEKSIKRGLAWIHLAISIQNGKEVCILALINEKDALQKHIYKNYNGINFKIYYFTEKNHEYNPSEVTWKEFIKWISKKSYIIATSEFISTNNRIFPWSNNFNFININDKNFLKILKYKNTI